MTAGLHVVWWQAVIWAAGWAARSHPVSVDCCQLWTLCCSCSGSSLCALVHCTYLWFDAQCMELLQLFLTAAFNQKPKLNYTVSGFVAEWNVWQLLCFVIVFRLYEAFDMQYSRHFWMPAMHWIRELHGDDTHTRARPFYGPLSGSTRVSQYQKKQSSTHTPPAHQPSLSSSSIYHEP